MILSSAMIDRIVRRAVEAAMGGVLIVFDGERNVSGVQAEGRTIPVGNVARAINDFYGNGTPQWVTLQFGPAGDAPEQALMYEGLERHIAPRRIRFEIQEFGKGKFKLVFADGDFDPDDAEPLVEPVFDALSEMDVYPPWEDGSSFAESVDAYLDYGSEIPSEFYENDYNWDQLVEGTNEFWEEEFKRDIERAIEKFLNESGLSDLGVLDFDNTTVGDVIAHMATPDMAQSMAVMDPKAIAEEIKDEFRSYEEHARNDYSDKASEIASEIREKWAERQLARRDDEKFKELKTHIENKDVKPLPNADLVRRMLKTFKEEDWEEMSFQQLAKQYPFVKRQERFWKALAKGSPKLRPKHMQDYLEGHNEQATRMLPKDFGGSALNPPKYVLVVEDDYEGYTIANSDEHMLGVVALYAEDMNEPDPKRAELIKGAMNKWHSSAHPISDSDEGIGWIRYDLVKSENDDETDMFIQEIQSDFLWAAEVAAAGGMPKWGGWPYGWENLSGGERKHLAKYILKKFVGWDRYLLGNIITLARQNGINDVIMNTSKTIKLNPASAPKSERKLRMYDELAKDLGFGSRQVDMYGNDERFHARAAALARSILRK